MGQGTGQQAGLFECIRERSRGVPDKDVAKVENLLLELGGNS